VRAGALPAALAAAALLLSGPTGCGVVALIHDKVIGPVSPAGRIHPLVVGSSFRVEETGPVADIDPGQLAAFYPPGFGTSWHPFRFYPPFPFERLYRTPRAVIRGFTFFVGFFTRYFFQRHGRVGRAPPPAEVSALEGAEATVTVGDVLDRLGPPRRWIKRLEGSVMLYGAEVSREWALSLGIPPGIGNLIPIPGVGNLLQFDYSNTEVERPRTILFFDPEDRLVSLATRDGARGEAAEADE